MEIFSHIQRMDAAFFDRNPVGTLITRATTDVEAIEESFSSGVVAIVGDFLRLIAIMALMVWLEWRLALVTFAVIPLMLGVSVAFRARIRDTYRDIRARLARINAYLQENVLGIKVVKLFAQEERAAEEFEERNHAHRTSELKGVFYESSFSAWIEFMGAALRSRPTRDFAVPDGIVFARIDTKTGLLASSQTETSLFQAFLEGTEPREQSPTSTSATDDQRRLRLDF
jgi:ATP-binding cassette subfamily B protein